MLLFCFNILSASEDQIADFFQTPLGILVITLAGGLIGGSLSYFLQRNLQYKTWLFENRITSFTEFIKTLEKSRAEASNYRNNLKNNKNQPRLSKDGKLLVDVWEIYEPSIACSETVRFLLKEKDRDEFAKLVDDYAKLHCIAKPDNEEDIRNEMRNTRKRIQKIIEKHLNYYPLWNFIKRLFNIKTHLKSLIKISLRKNLQKTQQS